MSKSNSHIKQGMLAASPFVPVLTPFAMIFGILAASLDLSSLQTFLYSAFVFAGASQIATLSMLADGTPFIIAVLAGAIIGLRMLLYSAALAPHFRGIPTRTRWLIAYALVDQAFVLGQQKYEAEPELAPSARVAYYAGVLIVVMGIWHAAAMAGFYFGNLIPAQYDISFGLPLSFVALIAPSLKSIPHWVAAFVSCAGTIALHSVPNNLGLLISAIIAIIIAAQVELILTRRQNV